MTDASDSAIGVVHLLIVFDKSLNFCIISYAKGNDGEK
jgi:hypothetical protein